MLTNQTEGLKRELGVTDVALNVLNIAIASGIFLLPAAIAGILGSESIIAYVLCGVMFLLVTLCYAEVGSRITTSGGAYTYIEKAFGPFVGFIAGGFFWFGIGVLISAAIINGIADMLSVPFPVFNQTFYRILFFAIVFGAIAYSNVTGAKRGMMVIKSITVVKLIPLVLLVVAGLIGLNADNIHWNAFPSANKLGAASLILFSAFAGGETALNMTGEMKNPQRTAPLGLIVATIILIVFYSLLQLVAQSALVSELAAQKAPLAAAAGVLLGSWAIKVLVACGVIAIFGSLYSSVLVFPRVLFAGGRDGLLPKFLSAVHPKYSTPHKAIITFAVIAFIMAVSGNYRQLLVLASISMLLLYAGVVLSVIRFRLKPDVNYPAGFLLPGGLIIPVTTLIVLSWFLFQSKMSELVAIVIFLVLLSAIYAGRYFFRKQPISSIITNS